MRSFIDLTDGFPFKFDVERMRADLARLNDAELLSHYDVGLSEGWRAALLVSKGGQMSGPESQRPAWITESGTEFQRTPLLHDLPYFREILDAMHCPQGRIRILKLAPGGGIGLHRDVGAEIGCFAFDQVRLHVPIITNDRVTFFVGGEKIKMQPGRLYYVNFSKNHYVKNEGDSARYHLVMDLRVNDWLRQFFPPLTSTERFENAWARAVWPYFWKLRWRRTQASILFWRHYNGSVVQRAVHAWRRQRAPESN